MVIGISWLTTWIAAVGSAGSYVVGLLLYYGCRFLKSLAEKNVVHFHQTGKENDEVGCGPLRAMIKFSRLRKVL
jgi:hypothetical protein